jgi:hypothetical protein
MQSDDRVRRAVILNDHDFSNGLKFFNGSAG